ncbi:MAG: glycosyltransferase [Bacteroidaceae bacterium]|nr:glycosyltransferase [Bacteroidaceae bacterium]
MWASAPNTMTVAPAEEPIYHHRTKLILWLRELGWKLGRWNSKELDSFLESVNPDVLLFPIESYPYFNRINEYIIEKCEPQKVVGYLWDDNFTYKQHPHSLVFKIERFFLRKQVRRLINSCTDVLAISPKMKEECDKEFGVDSIVITKPIFNCGEFEDYQAGTPVRILYTGKLIIGRDDTVIEVVKAIKEINKDGQKAILDIYTNTQLSEDKKAKIAVEGCCNLHDPVPQSEVAALQKQADVLLFAESLSDRDLTARLSFSTKLTDYFAAGKCIWAVGNSDLGPISYINSEDAGLVSTNIKEIRDTLEKMVSDKNLISDYARKDYDCGRRNHNGDEVIAKLHEVLIGND